MTEINQVKRLYEKSGKKNGFYKENLPTEVQGK